MSDNKQDEKTQIVVHKQIHLEKYLISEINNDEDKRVKIIKLMKTYGEMENLFYSYEGVQEAVRITNPTYKLVYKPELSKEDSTDIEEHYVRHIYIRDDNGNAKKIKVFTEDGLYDYLFKARNLVATRFRKFVIGVLKKLRKTGSVTMKEAIDEYKKDMARIEQENEKIRIKLVNEEYKTARKDLMIRDYQERIKQLDTDLNSELIANRLRAVMDEELKFQSICIYAGNYEYYPDKAEDYESKSVVFTLEGETSDEIMTSSQPYAFYFRPAEVKEKPAANEKKVKDQFGEDVTVADDKNEILVSYVKVRVDNDDGKEKKDTKSATIKKLLDFLDKECKIRHATKSRKTYMFCDYNMLKTFIDIYNYKETDEKFLKENNN